MAFGNYLSGLILSRMTRTDRIAYELGVPESLVEAWSNDKAVPTVENLYGLADFFNISVDDLKAHFPNNEKATSVPGDLTEDERDLLALWRELDPVKQAEFRGELRGYLKATKQEG